MKQNKVLPQKNIAESNNQKADTAITKSFDCFMSKYGLYFLLLIVSFIICFVFKDFLLLKKIYLFTDIGSDGINLSYPSYYNLANYFETEGFPKWSFNQGIGQNIFPLNIDPFLFFIISMGKDYVYYTMFFAEIFKIFFAGLFFYLFLKRILTSDYSAIVGGILYSFSGYVVLGGQWAFFSTQAVYIALLLYSFERLYQDNNWILFTISIFLIASFQPFYLYLIGLFLLIYVMFRLFEANEKDPKKIFGLFTKLACLGVLGVAMSSFFLVNIIQVMLQSPRGSGESSFYNVMFSKHIFGLEGIEYGKTHYLTVLMRFFSCDILGTGSNFKGWYNYLEAPLFYCGLISLVLFPHFLSLSGKRKKIIYFTLILIFAIPVIFPFFRYAYWLFAGNYYRIYSLFVAIVVLLIALKSIDNIDSGSKIDIKITIGTLFLLLLFLYYPYKNSRIIDASIRNTVAIFLIIYSVLVYLMQFKTIKHFAKFILLSVIIIELIYFSNITVNKRPVILGKEITQKVGYNDYTVDAVAFIKSKDKTFFRINKDYFSVTKEYTSFNDALAQDYYGTPSYYGFNQLNYVKFLNELGIIDMKEEESTRWIRGLAEWPLLHSFTSIKYSLSKDQKPFLFYNLGYYPDSTIPSFGDVMVLKNKYALPLGFTYEKYIYLKDFRSLTQIQKMSVLYKAVVIDDSVNKNFDNLAKLNLNDIPEKGYPFEEYSEDIRLLSQNTLDIIKHGQNEIAGNITVDKNKMLFFSIPFDKGWRVKVDGKSIAPLMVNVGFIGVPLEKGFHNIELSFTPLYYYEGAIISFISILLFICLIGFKYYQDRKIADNT